MRKSYLFALALVSLVITINLASAGYSYYNPGYKYSYPNQYSQEIIKDNQVNPSFINLPAISDKTSSINNENNFFTRNYQGPVIEKTTKYDEFFQISKRGKLTKSISSTTTERYIGALESLSKGSEIRSGYNRDYSNIPTNHYYYEGGSAWRYKSSFNAIDYSKGFNTYTRPYYYDGRYDSQKGYYNWRY